MTGNYYLALDVETANANAASICQIGIVAFNGNQIHKEWSTLVNPNAYFDPYNVGIHGITPEAVKDAPSFNEVFNELTGWLEEKHVVHHGHFDRTAFQSAYKSFELPPIACTWIDNTKVVRRTWEQFSKKGYGLANLVKYFGLTLDHHDALSDARAAGQVFAIASTETGNSLEDWVKVVSAQRASSGGGKLGTLIGVEGGFFFGETIVFTGELRETRSVAREAASQIGFTVKDSVTSDTTVLVLGTQDTDRFGPYSKSSKHRRAEQLAAKGQSITFMTEDDFWNLFTESQKNT